MPLNSDLTLNVSKFHPSKIPPEAVKLNEHLIKVMDGMPKWFEVKFSNLLAPKILIEANHVQLPR